MSINSSPKPIIVVLDNVRSAYNVGVIMRICAAFGVVEVWCIGLTPYPKMTNDERLPHVADKAQAAIAKTALGAEKHIVARHSPTAMDAMKELSERGFHIYAIEQNPAAIDIAKWRPRWPAAIVLGHEVDGISDQTIDRADAIVEIPMPGKKESLNVATAAAIAIYEAISHQH